MSHRDAEITEVVVVISQPWAEKLTEAVEKLKSAGLDVFSVDEDESVINGAIETYKLAALQKIDAVNYVRTVETYIADYQVGDARDKDLVEDEEPEESDGI
jgi:hypothetical protein